MSKRSGRSPRTDKEITATQRLAHEKRELQKEVGRLKKQLARFDAGWCPSCFERANGGSAPEIEQEQPKPKNRICFKCHEGNLKLFKYHKGEEVWYFRSCETCGHRTKGKIYTDEVKD
jgi:hypothetical protein